MGLFGDLHSYPPLFVWVMQPPSSNLRSSPPNALGASNNLYFSFRLAHSGSLVPDCSRWVHLPWVQSPAVPVSLQISRDPCRSRVPSPRLSPLPFRPLAVSSRLPIFSLLY